MFKRCMLSSWDADQVCLTLFELSVCPNNSSNVFLPGRWGGADELSFRHGCLSLLIFLWGNPETFLMYFRVPMETVWKSWSWIYRVKLIFFKKWGTKLPLLSFCTLYVQSILKFCGKWNAKEVGLAYRVIVQWQGKRECVITEVHQQDKQKDTCYKYITIGDDHIS